MSLLCDVVGHAQLQQHFRRVLAAGELAHAYLFVGPRGVGKSTFAQALARAVLCSGNPGVGCASCPSCHKVQSGTHPDLRVVTPGEDEVFSIALVRELCTQVLVAPWESNLRLFVLEDIDRLQVEAANALLKTLEEPPPHARLILITQNMGSVLPTIESRCQLVRFGPLGTDAMVGVLQSRGMSEPEARVLAGVSNGSLGDALASEQGLQACRTHLLEVWSAGVAPGEAGRQLGELLAGQSTAQARRMARQTLDLLTSLLRDRLAQRLGAADRLNPDVPQSLLDALPADPERVMARIDSLQDWREAVDANVNPRTVLEDAGTLLAGLR